MGVCDICNAPGMGTLISAEQMREAVFKNGFNPFKLGLTPDLASAFGLGAGGSYNNWKNTIVAQDTSDWNICSKCMTKLKPYLKGAPKPTGVKKATVSSDPLVSILAGSKAQEKYKPAKQPDVTPKPKIKPKTTTTLKKCPFCGEEILPAAIKCKHCGEWLGEKPHGERDEYVEYKGVKGWLLILCIILTIISPLFSIISLISSYNLASTYFYMYPGLRIVTIIDTILSIGLIAFSIYAGISLWKVKSGAVKIAKKYLRTFLGYSIIAIFLPFTAGLPSQANSAMLGAALGIAIRSWIFIAIWYSYLNKSKRVKATYQK